MVFGFGKKSRRVVEPDASGEPLRDTIVRPAFDWKARKRRTLRWLSVHPSTYQQLVTAGFFVSYKTAQRNVSRWAKKKQTKCVGTVRGEDGRPTYMYGSWEPRSKQHDKYVTDFCIAYKDAEFERGNELEHYCDCVMKLNGETFYVELDTGEMSLPQVRRRWRAYSECQGIVMVVSLSERRLGNVLNASELLDGFSVFTTLTEAINDPYGLIWLDRNLSKIGVEKPDGF